MRRKLFIVIASILGCFMLGLGSLSAQTMTTFSKCVISFESNPEGSEVIYNGKVIGTTPCKAELKADYLISCDSDNASSMSPSDIKGYNSIKIENYIKDSSQSSGAFPFFGMTFTIKDKQGHIGTVTVPLKWEEISILGMKGSRVFYPDSVKYEFQ